MTHRLAIIGGTLALSIAVAAAASGQTKATKGSVGPTMGTQIGVAAGVNVFTFGGSDAADLKSRTAFFAGVALHVPLGPTAFLEPQVLYSQEGAKSSVTDSTFGTIEGTFKLSYLRVPVLFGLNFQRNGLGPHLFAGPSIGLKVGCDIEASAQGQTASSSCSDGGLDLKSTDFAVTGGAGITLPVGRGTFSIDARYTLGLTDITDGSNAKNQGFSVGAGFTLPLGSR